MTEPMSAEQLEEIKAEPGTRLYFFNAALSENDIRIMNRVLSQRDELLAEASRLRAERPTAYTPREEVTEGWYTAKRLKDSKRYAIKTIRTPTYAGGGLVAMAAGCTVPIRIADFTDFLPIPAYLIDGIESEVRDD